MPSPKLFIDDEYEGDDMVSYNSKNKIRQASFTAATPPNSRHAARLAKIAMAVQQPQKSNSHSKKRAAYLPSSRPREQIEYKPKEQRHYSPPPLVGSQQQQHYHSTPAHGQVPTEEADYANPEATQYTQTQSQTYANSDDTGTYYQDHSSPVTYGQPATTQSYPGVVPYQTNTCLIASHQPGATIQEVTRVRTEQKTAYKVKSDMGTLRVSAPVGSNEAQLFDAIAEANAVSSRVSLFSSGFVWAFGLPAANLT